MQKDLLKLIQHLVCIFFLAFRVDIKVCKLPQLQQKLVNFRPLHVHHPKSGDRANKYFVKSAQKQLPDEALTDLFN